ncbi:hypothetical protein WN944_001156 [Citrus x changshan-huyou]|uniref:DOG1 domain-containing protein n=1 Tax=Citrus x changshan-huyou TaxID=2935761 RepID=A0AAP0QQX8_9ROSI
MGGAHGVGFPIPSQFNEVLDSADVIGLLRWLIQAVLVVLGGVKKRQKQQEPNALSSSSFYPSAKNPSVSHSQTSFFVLPELLFPSWRNNLEISFLFLGDLHPYVFTNLVRSFVDEESKEEEEEDDDDDDDDEFFENRSDEGLKGVIGEERKEEMDDIVSVFVDANRLRKSVSVFVDANRLRKSVIAEIVGTMFIQAALFLEALPNFLLA